MSERTLTDRTTIAAVFQDWAAAESAVNALKSFGLRDDQIGVMLRREHLSTHQHRRAPSSADEVRKHDRDQHDVVPGLDRSQLRPTALDLAEVGTVAVGGTLAAAFGVADQQMHANQMRAPAERISERLAQVGVSADEARGLEAALRDGAVLVTASVYERPADVENILTRHGGACGPHAAR